MNKIKHILSVIHYIICGAVCFQFTHVPCDDWENVYILCLIIIIIKSEVWTITHCLGLGHETMVCSVCLSIFLCPCDFIVGVSECLKNWYGTPCEHTMTITGISHKWHDDMGVMTTQINGNSIVCARAYSDIQQRKHQISALMSLCKGAPLKNRCISGPSCNPWHCI